MIRKMSIILKMGEKTSYPLPITYYFYPKYMEFTKHFFAHPLQLIIFIILAILVFINARIMGYSGFLWLLVSVLYMPLVSLYLLAALPNRKLDEQRKKEMSLLQKQLEQRRWGTEEGTSNIPGQTISDEETRRDDYPRNLD